QHRIDGVQIDSAVDYMNVSFDIDFATGEIFNGNLEVATAIDDGYAQLIWNAGFEGVVDHYENTIVIRNQQLSGSLARADYESYASAGDIDTANSVIAGGFVP